MWTSHVTKERVMPRKNESCHTRTSHVTCERVMWHVNRVTSHMHQSQAEWAVSNMCRRVMRRKNKVMSHMNESYHFVGKSCHISACHTQNEQYQRMRAGGMSRKIESCRARTSHVTRKRSPVTCEQVTGRMSCTGRCAWGLCHARTTSCHMWTSRTTL